MGYCIKTCGLLNVLVIWEGHKILQNLQQLFVLYTASQIIGEFSQNSLAFLEYMNFNKTDSGRSAKRHFHSLGGINPIATTYLFVG